MTRDKRIALELFGPAPLGLLAIFLFFAVGTVANKGRGLSFPPDILLLWAGIYLVYAYLIAGIPSIVFAVIMEWIFSRGLDPSTWSTVVLSTALGGIAGCAIVVFPSWMGPGEFPLEALAVFAPVGLVVGFTLGFVIMRASIPRKPSKSGRGWRLGVAWAWSRCRHWRGA